MSQEESAAETLFQFSKSQDISKFSHVYRVTFGDTDAMDIVHHSTYVGIMERARIAFMDQTPWPYTFWAKHKIHLPVVDLEIHYSAPFHFDEFIQTKVRLSTKGVRVFLDYELFPLKPKKGFDSQGIHFDLSTPPGRPHVSGRTTHVAMGEGGDAKRFTYVLKLFQTT